MLPCIGCTSVDKSYYFFYKSTLGILSQAHFSSNEWFDGLPLLNYQMRARADAFPLKVPFRHFNTFPISRNSHFSRKFHTLICMVRSLSFLNSLTNDFWFSRLNAQTNLQINYGYNIEIQKWYKKEYNLS